MKARGLPPVIDAGIETLILGSFPSTASLARGQYYGHPRNHFWPLLAAILDEPLPQMAYPDRLVCLLAHRIGVWDVIGECARAGSLDSAIRDATGNAFAPLLAGTPRLRRVCFNGATAARQAGWFEARGYPVHRLPSSSPAYTIGFDAKLARWREALTSPRGAAPAVPGRRPQPARLPRRAPSRLPARC
jgi:double-stranded uracil-DNA glycosylase